MLNLSIKNGNLKNFGFGLMLHFISYFEIHPSIHPSINFPYLGKGKSKQDETESQRLHLHLDFFPSQDISTAVWAPACEQKVNMSLEIFDVQYDKWYGYKI